MLLCIVYAMLFVNSENYWDGSLRKLWVEMCECVLY